MNEITPSEITGFIFPNNGSEANEIALRVARHFTQKPKIMSRYRSFHGAASAPLNATGDFRRGFTEY